jgi:polyhydroxybutyrate depolymerase
MALAACASAQAAPTLPKPASLISAPAPGCGRPTHSGITVTLTPQVDGRRRTIRVYVPRGYLPGRAVPLVVNLHGTTSSAARHEIVSGMDAMADTYTFLVAYPQGDRRFGTGYGWNVPNTPAWSAHGPDDVAFLLRVVLLLRERYCMNAARVYATGFSGGGRMISQVACHPDHPFAAVAAVGGLRAPVPCQGGPVPVLGVHGTADPLNPFDGPGQSYWTYGVPDAARRWAAHNHCASLPTVGTPRPGVSLSLYHGCQAEAAVGLYALAGTGHVWPSARTAALDANEVIWRFFTAHPLGSTSG